MRTKDWTPGSSHIGIDEKEQRVSIEEAVASGEVQAKEILRLWGERKREVCGPLASVDCARISSIN